MNIPLSKAIASNMDDGHKSACKKFVGWELNIYNTCWKLQVKFLHSYNVIISAGNLSAR